MWMRINLELRIHLETPLKGFFPWNSVGVFLWNFSRNTFWNAFQDFLQESFHIFSRHFSWYFFSNSIRRLFRLLTSIFPRLEQFFPGFFLENLQRFLKSYRFLLKFLKINSRYCYQRPSWDFLEVLPAFCPNPSFSQNISQMLSRSVSWSFSRDYSCRFAAIHSSVSLGTSPGDFFQSCYRRISGISIRAPQMIS